MNEADEEHHVGGLLIAELDTVDGSESHADATFAVPAENVRHRDHFPPASSRIGSPGLSVSSSTNSTPS